MLRKEVILVISVLWTLMYTDIVNAAGNSLMQFTAGDHVLGFEKTGIMMAMSSHALKIEFQGTKGVIPQSSEEMPAGKGKTIPLQEIRYPGLWQGITLVYTATKVGILESTYYIEPHADISKIRLKYNLPVKTTKTGALTLTFETGYMTESPPIGWQEVDGKKIPVKISFRTMGPNSIGFETGFYDPAHALIIDPVLTWNTFLGASSADSCYGIALDSSGNIYVIGDSYDTWGAPNNAHAGSDDIVVAKLNSSGVLLWNTFLGSSDVDWGFSIAVDSSGNIYVTGGSFATWGTPNNAYAGSEDIFAAKLDSNGVLLWNTFLGSSSEDCGFGITVDSNSYIYITGFSYTTWGTPNNAHAGNYDIAVARLDSNGILQWNTFLGSSGSDSGLSISLDSSGNIYVTGGSDATWGTPKNSHAGGNDTFAAKLDSSGVLLWNTFIGSSDWDSGYGIAVDSGDNVYVTGGSSASWCTPINAYSGGQDIFAAMLDNSGILQWNTFLGSSEEDDDFDCGFGIAIDSSSYVYVTGRSNSILDTPGSEDIFAARLDSNGILQWNTSLGSSDSDSGRSIVVDNNGNVYATGYSYATWGTPNNAYVGSGDIVISVLSPSAPTVTTTTVSNITTTTASCGGEVTDKGDYPVTVRGICWNTPGSPTTSDNATTDGSGTGTYISSLTGLSPDTTYYYRAYAVNSIGTAYGDTYSFTTSLITNPDHPVISTPTNGETIQSGEVILSINPYTGAGTHTRTLWRVWRWDKPEPSDDTCPTCIDQTESDTNLLTYTVTGLPSGMKYGWQSGVEADGLPGIVWSDTSTFIIGEITTDSSVELAADNRILVSFPMWLQNGDALTAVDQSSDAWIIQSYDTMSGYYTDDSVIEPGYGYFGESNFSSSLPLAVSGVPVTLEADLEVMLDYNTSTGDGRNLIGPSNNSAYLWEDVEVVVYNETGNIVFGSTAIGDMDNDNPYLELTLETWDGDGFLPSANILAPYTGYRVIARQAGVSLRFPQSAQTEIETENSLSGSSSVNICFIGISML